MSRRPRLQFAGAVYHVMARGNRKSTIFQDDEDRRQFLQIVGAAAASYDLLFRAFCLMGNHYHLVLETPEPNLSDAMQYINGVFCSAVESPTSTNRTCLRRTVSFAGDSA